MDKIIFDDEEAPQPQVGDKKGFNLADALNNAKMFGKMKEDQRKFKMLLTEMSVYIQEHQVAIKGDLVSEEKLRLTVEFLENQLHEQLERRCEQVITKLAPKIKKRCKYKDIKNQFIEKVSHHEFKSEIVKINNFT